ncbi:MAG: CrcB family protein [Planctomycetota bacterium]
MTSWTSLLAVACGGALGATFRWLLTAWAASGAGHSATLGTTLANVLGCGMIGLAAVAMTPEKWPPPIQPVPIQPVRTQPVPVQATPGQAAETVQAADPGQAAAPGQTAADARFPPWVALFIRVGLIGSLTTFSTFVFEAVEMAWRGESTSLAIYVAANLGLGLVTLIAGLATGHWLLAD